MKIIRNLEECESNGRQKIYLSAVKLQTQIFGMEAGIHARTLLTVKYDNKRKLKKIGKEMESTDVMGLLF